MNTATWTRDEIILVARNLRERAREHFIREGCFEPPIAFIFAQADPETGERRATVFVLQTPIPSGSPQEVDHRKDANTRVIRLVAERAEAAAVALVSECWVGSTAPIEEHAPDVRPEDDPARKEILFFLLKTIRFGDRAWTAQIARDGEGKVTVSEWEEGRSGKGRLDGMLAKLD